MKSFFSKFKEGLKKSTPTFYKAFGKVGGLFGGRTIDAETLDEIEEALYLADFGVETTEDVLDAIREAVKENKELRGQDEIPVVTSNEMCSVPNETERMKTLLIQCYIQETARKALISVEDATKEEGYDKDRDHKTA